MDYFYISYRTIVYTLLMPVITTVYVFFAVPVYQFCGPSMVCDNMLCGVVYSVSIDNTFDNPIRISSIIEPGNSPSRYKSIL